MKINLTRKEANLVMAVLWDLANESASVHGPYNAPWRLAEVGRDLATSVMDKLDEANGKDDNALSGAPKKSIEQARWSA